MTNRRFSERDVEHLFAGRTPADDGLARLSPIVEAIRLQSSDAPTAERTDQIARTLAVAARESVAHPLSRRERRVATAPVPLARRLVAVGGVLALATVGVGGTAVAADGAAPGDLLYSIDRTFEAVGILDGGTTERLDESARLANEGDLDAALKHAAEAVEAEGDSGSAESLTTAATAVNSQGSEQSAEVRAAVTETLNWMASQDPKGRDFGQGVSERAREIGESASHGHGNSGQGTSGNSTPGTNGNTDSGTNGNSNHGMTDGSSGGKTGDSNNGPTGKQNNGQGNGSSEKSATR